LDAQQAVAPRRGARARRTVGSFLRFAIGLILFATAIGKLLDVPGFAAVLDTYEVFPQWALFPLAVAVPLAELLLAAWLFTGRNLFGAALVSAAMHASYAVWAAATLARGMDIPNCGCFGVFLARPLTRSTVVEDGVMVVASLALAFASGRAEKK
jgi:hypothetical protein